jgi:hypothetical protein
MLSITIQKPFIFKITLQFPISSAKNFQETTSKMKFLLIILIFKVLQISSQKVVTCKMGYIKGYRGCRFTNITIEESDSIIIETDPPNAPDINDVTHIEFTSPSIHFIPSGIFSKFVNLEWFQAWDQNLQEIRVGTFKGTDKLRTLSFRGNKIAKLHVDTFNSEKID